MSLTLLCPGQISNKVSIIRVKTANDYKVNLIREIFVIPSIATSILQPVTVAIAFVKLLSLIEDRKCISSMFDQQTDVQETKSSYYLKPSSTVADIQPIPPVFLCLLFNRLLGDYITYLWRGWVYVIIVDQPFSYAKLNKCFKAKLRESTAIQAISQILSNSSTVPWTFKKYNLYMQIY